MIAEVVHAEEWHAEVIGLSPRAADMAEFWALARATPAQCLRQGLRLSTGCYTGLIDGRPVCMFGVTPYSILRGWGVPWMVGSTGLDSLGAQKALLRESHAAVAEMSRQFPVLFNVVDDRNAAAKRWLLWLGFRLGAPEPMGPDLQLFRPFILEA